MSSIAAAQTTHPLPPSALAPGPAGSSMLKWMLEVLDSACCSFSGILGSKHWDVVVAVSCVLKALLHSDSKV